MFAGNARSRNAFGLSMARTWSAELELKGAGGEPVDLLRTITSHGVADLPPNDIDPDAVTLTTTLAQARGAATVLVSPGRKGFAQVEGAGPKAGVLDAVRHMLRLDADLSGFYTVAAADPELTWAATGAGRLLRSPTVFEDVVKTICTTNCTWSATVRMTTALVDHLGPQAPDGRRAFPIPAAMAEAGETFYRDVVRAGYRGAYLRSLAESVNEGRLDLEALDDPELTDDEVAERLLAIPGCGPYATAHMMMLLGRYSRLDAPDVCTPAWPQGRRPHDRAALPPLPRLCGPRLLAVPDARLGRGLNLPACIAGGWLAALIADREPVLPLGRGAVRPRVGVNPALRLLLDAVVADRGGRVQTVGDVRPAQGGQIAGLGGVVRPDAGEAIGLELGAHGAAGRAGSA
jgi:N-glycosylase/DNA lyase